MKWLHIVAILGTKQKQRQIFGWNKTSVLVTRISHKYNCFQTWILTKNNHEANEAAGNINDSWYNMEPYQIKKIFNMEIIIYRLENAFNVLIT